MDHSRASSLPRMHKHEPLRLHPPSLKIPKLKNVIHGKSRLIWCPRRSPMLPHKNGMAGRNIQLTELRRTGQCTKMVLTQDEFINSLSDHKLPFRDLRMLLKSTEGLSKGTRHPALLPRPSSQCFIFEMEHIKLLCFSDKCLILNPDDKATQNFICGLKMQFHCEDSPPLPDDYSRLNADSSMRLLYQKSVQDLDFEHVILENALENIVRKFRRHLQIIKPALEMLLQQIEQNPETNGLKRLLAVKKSLAEFEQNVEHVMKVIRAVLGDDEDMLSLYLTHPDRREGEQEEVELLLSSYSADLDEIETEIKIFIDMIEDTDQFISAHLDSVRNEIIKMSLFIEVGGLIMGFGAVVSGIFGMNLNNKIEDDPWAFLIVCGCIIIAMLFFFLGFTKKYFQLKADTSSAQNFTLLKNFFTYVDDLEYHVFNKRIEKGEFKDAVEKITGLKITNKESEYLFKMVDVNQDGIIDAEEELNFHQHRVPEYGIFPKEHSASLLAGHNNI